MRYERTAQVLKDVLSSKKALAASGLSVLALAGCGGHTVTGSINPIEQCGKRVYNYRFGKTPLSAAGIEQAVATSKGDVLELQKRAEANGGSINLADYEAVEVQAPSDGVVIGFTATTDHFLIGYDVTGDYVGFGIQGGEPKVASGAIICSANGNLYTNGTYQGLEKYARETATFPSK